MNVTEILSKMTLREKIQFCTGADFWHSKPLKKADLPAFVLADGPHGLRFQPGKGDMLGINSSAEATCFPAAVTAGAAWNPELCAEEGAAIGREALAAGVSVVLGPGCNLKRNPLGGRNFEYYSEDPFLSGKLAAGFVRGQQATGVSSCLKHFAVNNQEFKRQNGSSRLDERTLRELYLTPFELAVKESHPDTVMCAYNQINGVHCSDNARLLTEILREEWGFSGMVVTDWGGMNDRIAAFRAGCDLNMPGGSRYMEQATVDAVQNGTLDEACIDASVTRILRMAEKHRNPSPAAPVDWDAHHALARKIAVQGAVLLKNDSSLLPVLSEEIVLIGRMAKTMRYQGTGSSHINPKRLVSLSDALPGVPLIACGDSNGTVTEEELEAAVSAARTKRVAVVVVGLPESYESEAADREHLRLPEGYDRLVKAVANANENTAVLLLGGSPMELPWADRVKAILYFGLPGQAGGEAAADLLTGKAVPCGKLTETWPLSYRDVVSRETFGQKHPEYREGIYVGYRYYDTAALPVRFPFGHGLSYTTFAYSGLRVSGRTVALHIQNTGAVHGAEVVQCYLSPPDGGLFRPKQELKAFARVELAPGEATEVRFSLDDRSFSVWGEGGWRLSGGEYTVRVGASSRDIRLSGSLSVCGDPLPAPDWQTGSWYESPNGVPPREAWELLMGCPVPVLTEPKKGEFTANNTCAEMKEHSLLMRLQYTVTGWMLAAKYRNGGESAQAAYRMMLISATDCPLRAIQLNVGRFFSDSLTAALVHWVNGRVFAGIRALFRR